MGGGNVQTLPAEIERAPLLRWVKPYARLSCRQTVFIVLNYSFELQLVYAQKKVQKKTPI